MSNKRILVYYGQHDNDYWLIDTPARRVGAMRELFKQLDKKGFYVDEDESHVALARLGDPHAIEGILNSRRCFGYEEWEIKEASVCE